MTHVTSPVIKGIARSGIILKIGVDPSINPKTEYANFG